MRHIRPALGILASVVMIASAVLHSVWGWPGLLVSVSNYSISPLVLTGLQVPWHLAGVGMFGFGAVSLAHYGSLAFGGRRDAWPVRIIGALYAGFGLWALATVARDPFFLTFVIPGLVVSLCAVDTWPALGGDSALRRF
jgi:hypothetical protein